MIPILLYFKIELDFKIIGKIMNLALLAHRISSKLAVCPLSEFVGNKAKGRISKQVFPENKACQIFRKINISYLLIRKIVVLTIQTNCKMVSKNVEQIRF